MNSNEIATSFLNTYYTTMMNSRDQLINFYTENSMLTNEGKNYSGLKEITERIESFSFKSINFQFSEYDLQPSPYPNGLLIFVTGSLTLDGDTTFNFAHTFQLLPNNNGYYIHNEMFRNIL